jgi:hypothetical protein
MLICLHIQICTLSKSIPSVECPFSTAIKAIIYFTYSVTSMKARLTISSAANGLIWLRFYSLIDFRLPILQRKIHELKAALGNVKTLQGLIPICPFCRKIRDGRGFWNQLEKYVVEHSDAELPHGDL